MDHRTPWATSSSRDATSKVPFRFSYFDSAEEWLGGFKDRGLVSDVLARGVANAYRLGLVDVPGDGYLYPDLPLSEPTCATMIDRAFTRPVTVRTTAPKAVSAKASYPTLKFKSEGSSGLVPGIPAWPRSSIARAP